VWLALSMCLRCLCAGMCVGIWLLCARILMSFVIVEGVNRCLMYGKGW
jgi:hypothetical protein